MMQAPGIPLFPARLQELHPKQARFCLKVERFLKDEGVSLKKRRVLAAFSGGADSSALLLSLHYLSRKLDFSLSVAHLDHALRPSSAEEVRYCETLCERLGLAFAAQRVDIRAACAESGLGTEEAARAIRYEFYGKQAAAMGCGLVALGHNANDLAEDILMRLMRGSGWPGLSGMVAVDSQRSLLRPLLRHTRAEIEDFVSGFGAGWLHDESNDDHNYLRNRVRHTVLPLFLRENPAFLDAAIGLNRLGRFDEDWLGGLVEVELAKALAHSEKDGEISHNAGVGVSGIFFASDQLQNLPKALRLRLYKAALDRLGPGQARLDSLLKLETGWENALQTGSGEVKRFQFPGEKSAVVTAAGIGWNFSGSGKSAPE